MVSTRLSDQVGRVVSARYRLIAPLGTGASAQVFLAEDVELGRQVAVKMLQPALADDERFLRRFRAEAQNVAAINHPNVVVIHDWGEDEVPYLVSEYLAGGSLRAMLHEGRRLSPSQALVVGLDVCRGLAYAHNAGLVHRDLKPANLLFDPEGRLRIADFGLARAIAEASVTEPEGSVMGTARYAAPEQARGERLDGKADVYALAVLLIESITGVAPFVSDTTFGTLMARIDRDLDVPEDVGALRPALERAGRLHPEDRPDAEELGILLLAAAERMDAPSPLPLVGALTEAGQDGESDVTRTMTMLPLGAVAEAAGDAAPTEAEGDAAADDGSAPPDEPDAPESAGRPARWWVPVAVLFAVTLGVGGFLLFQALQTPTHEVPAVLGDQIDDLALIAEQNDWTIDENRTRRDGTEPDEILATDPSPGEQLEEGGTLVVTVSEGNTLSDLPGGVADRPLDEVAAELEDAGLVAVPTEVFDEQIAAGNVIRYGFDGDVPERLPKGEEVPLVASQGPEPRVVPEYADDTTYEDYAASLADLQLVAERKDEFSPDVPEGRIMRLSHEPGTEVPRDSTVTAVVSKGPDVVDVPDTTGMTLDEAEAALESAGLTLGEFVGGGGDRTVGASDPEPGATVPRGTSVNLLLRR
ncbi:MAG: protein kinase [Acidimicrobiales bacterium]|nr:protein kinase [Acidimicrobiales bacterium]